MNDHHLFTNQFHVFSRRAQSKNIVKNVYQYESDWNKVSADWTSIGIAWELENVENHQASVYGATTCIKQSLSRT